MNTNKLRTLKFAALIIPLLLIFVISQEYLFDFRNYDTVRIERFYEQEEDSLDVVLIGASEVFTGYSPGYAYDKYGFTSYMYAMDANQGSLYLSQLKEILKTQSPEILFVDMYGFLHADDTSLFDEARMRLYVESIPLSENKVQTIMDYPCDHKLSYFLPMIMYHGDPSIAYGRLAATYHSLAKEAKPASLKGALTRTLVYTGNGDPGAEFDPSTYVLSEDSKAYLIEFLEYCKANNPNRVIFTNFPRNLVDDSNHSMLHLLEQAQDIVEEYGYPVWDFQAAMDEIGIDETQDFYNEHHMNIYGQVKLTDYMGSRIVNECGLTPRTQSEQSKQDWDQVAVNTREYIEMAMNVIQSGEDLVIFEGEKKWLYRQ